jgi:hypothetical protein
MKKLLLLLLLLIPLLTFAQRHRRDSIFVKVQSERMIDSRAFKAGQTCTFTVVENVYLGDSLIIEKGAKAYGTVAHSVRARGIGDPGLLEVKPEYVMGVNRDYDFSGPIMYSEGRSRRVQACALAFISPLFLLIRGQEAHIYPSTVIELVIKA